MRSLYESYGGMLLGYISAIVKDNDVAESYLVKIFTDISNQFDTINWSESSTWQLLRNFAKHELAVFTNAVRACEYDTRVDDDLNTAGNKYLDRMTAEQKNIFCSVYYHRYTTAQIAAELNKTEAYINGLLKQAFAVIKQSHHEG